MIIEILAKLEKIIIYRVNYKQILEKTYSSFPFKTVIIEQFEEDGQSYIHKNASYGDEVRGWEYLVS